MAMKLQVELNQRPVSAVEWGELELIGVTTVFGNTLARRIPHCSG